MNTQAPGSNNKISPGVTKMTMAMLNKGQQQQPSADIPQSVSQQVGSDQWMCYSCGEKGHRAHVCPNNSNPEAVTKVMRNQGQEPCMLCGHWGHSVYKCWNNKANAYLLSTGWKGPYHLPGYTKTGGAHETVKVSIDQVRNPKEYSAEDDSGSENEYSLTLTWL
jgi:hypothetical protein